MTAAGGKRIEIGLGGESAIALGAVRKIADQMREAVVLGRNPREVLQPTRPTKRVPSFGEYADAYISSVESGWKNPTHRQQWRNSLRDHARTLAGKQVDQITTDDVLEVLRPIWLKTPETASRVRSRIERILDAAKAQGHVPREDGNPARLKGHLDHLLPRQGGMSRGHHKALPYSDVAKFMAELGKRDAPAARCLEFTVLTAARSGEALGASWEEIDLDQRLWRVPASRMKAGAEHVVPLSDPAVALLKNTKLEASADNGLIFSVNGVARSNMAMGMLLRRMKYEHITVHGFRSTFRDWAGDCTQHPREVIEAALAHTIQDKAEKAYRRGTALERRRQLMHEWADFLQKG
jgi:integrase